MHCTICSYSWCWTCGFGDNHCFHTVMFGGMFCQLFNLAFGFEIDLHWTIRFLIAILAIPLAPVIFFIAAAIAFFGVLIDKMDYCEDIYLLLCCIPWPRFCLFKIIYFLLWII